MEPVKRLKQLMLETCAHPQNIEHLCELAGASYEKLRKEFRRVEGMTLSEYYQKVPLEAAEQKLRDFEKPIFLIAYELGFRYESNFSLWFYRRKGLWPTEYRKQLEVESGGDK